MRSEAEKAEGEAFADYCRNAKPPITADDLARLRSVIAHCRKHTHPGVTTSTSLLAQEIIDLCCGNLTGASTNERASDCDSVECDTIRNSD